MYSKYIGNLEEGFYAPPLPPLKGVLFPSEPVSQYRCMNLSKTDDNDRAQIEIIQTPYILTYGQYFFQDKCLI